MSLISLPSIEYGEAPASGPTLHGFQESHCTKRAAELQAKVERLRALLQEAEERLRYEQSRWPEIGEFVRCPLTGFFGQVTNIRPRPHGRPWVEVLLYLGKDMPGHTTIDLYENWELMDAPEQDTQFDD
ncbi:hypothetical protein [Microvirga guangxiensis]|uniref:Uncharacterized protein n=1 Tax=Microvirga guangxiensis TaxID=549386 RepID=A0A1G5IUQ3_9HYPH|nr:hypothetical protein [Microvirga guangxiensis]SCY79747.1 hypothetical protein SAMN02927923_02325 [Microvirga guangxiensis]